LYESLPPGGALSSSGDNNNKRIQPAVQFSPRKLPAVDPNSINRSELYGFLSLHQRVLEDTVTSMIVYYE